MLSRWNLGGFFRYISLFAFLFYSASCTSFVSSLIVIVAEKLPQEIEDFYFYILFA